MGRSIILCQIDDALERELRFLRRNEALVRIQIDLIRGGPFDEVYIVENDEQH